MVGASVGFAARAASWDAEEPVFTIEISEVHLQGPAVWA